MDKKDLLLNGVKEYGIELSNDQIDKMFVFKDILLEYNKVMNLTAILDEDDFIIKHLIDSLSVVPQIKKFNCNLIDIGTGAGFPGIPLKICRDDINITLVDSLAKRVKFLNEVIDKLELKNIVAIHARAEELAHKAEFRECYEYCTARAVANLPVLLEYCIPFVKLNGQFIAMKGISKDEVDKSSKALKILGGGIKQVIEFKLPYINDERSIIIVDKIHQTSTKYPRKSGKPSKEPLI